jgi:hypothetical protein
MKDVVRFMIYDLVGNWENGTDPKDSFGETEYRLPLTDYLLPITFNP